MKDWLKKYTVGWFVPYPEFITVLANQDVERGGEVVLSCEVNMPDVTAAWEKDGRKLCCVQGKHSIGRNGKVFKLTIKNTEEVDEGEYTLTLQNFMGSASCSATVTLALKEWRKIPLKPNEMVKALTNYTISNSEVTELRFLLHGDVGAGKSSVINTIKTIFENRQFINCLAAEGSATSHTQNYQKYSVGRFAFYDVMGLENGESDGARTDDIIKALKGHLKNCYEFKPDSPISEDDDNYIRNPSLNDRIHCLVSVVAADRIALMDNNIISKMKVIRTEASKLGIPQVTFLTRVDLACIMTKADLSKIYQSKRIKTKMQECSNILTVPMNCIFPVKNYHEETELNEHVNRLVLDAVTKAVHWANDYVKNYSEKERHVE